MKKKRIFLGVITFAIIGGAWFGYGEYSRKVKSLKNMEVQFTIESGDLIAAYEKSETEANTKFLDKIIAVKGNVKAIDKNDRGNYTIVIGDGGSMSAVRCCMDSVYVKDMEGVRQGSRITVKGACTGFNADELLGSDVILNRCVIETEK